MKTAAICAGFTALAFSVGAQEFKDASFDSVPDNDKATFLSLLLGTVSDPFSTQVLRLKPAEGRSDRYCGFLNTKNLNGAYTGFKPFLFVTDQPRLYLDSECR